jgi:hypothetical protein
MRDPVRLQKLDRILLAESELQPLMTKTRDLRALAILADSFFPPELTREVRLANFRDGELVLVAASAAAAAKLRLLGPSLSSYLQKQRWQVNSVSIRVQPNRSRGESAATRKKAYLSTHTLDSLRSLYEGMTASPAREALGKLLARQGTLKRS